MSRRARERADARPWDKPQEERNAWNCPHCAPKICDCNWRKDDDEQDEPQRCPDTSGRGE